MLWTMFVIVSIIYCVAVLWVLTWAFQSAVTDTKAPVPEDLRDVAPPYMDPIMKSAIKRKVVQRGVDHLSNKGI